LATNVIVADPPWKFRVWSEESGSGRSLSTHYPVSDLDAIKSLDVQSISADDAVLFLRAIPPMLPQALEVMAAWGFQFRRVGSIERHWRAMDPSP
jgi:N6-adenosine-specific RNA methylase IME4